MSTVYRIFLVIFCEQQQKYKRNKSNIKIYNETGKENFFFFFYSILCYIFYYSNQFNQK